MTDEEIKKIAYEPITDAWKVIHLAQHLMPNDDKGWTEYINAFDEFCKKYGYSKGDNYGHYLGLAIMAAAEKIARENEKNASV